MSKEHKINYFGFIVVLFLGFLTLSLPDKDLSVQGLIGHRSIITHSILFPFLLHYFLIQKKDHSNNYIVIFIIGFYLAIAMHLSADLHPKAWRGNAFIKLPGNISIGTGLSIIWMGLNAIVAIYFSTILLKKISNTKKYLITYLAIALIVGSIYTINDKPPGAEGGKFLTFLFFLFATFFYSLRKSKTRTLINTKGLKKFVKIVVGIILVGVAIILIVIGIEHSAEKDKQRQIKEEKQSNYRAYDVYKDEFNICKNKITRKYPKKNFSEFSWASYSAPKNQKRYTKTIIMTMKHDGFVLKNKYFGKVACYIIVRSDQSIAFARLGNKYK